MCIENTRILFGKYFHFVFTSIHINLYAVRFLMVSTCLLFWTSFFKLVVVQRSGWQFLEVRAVLGLLLCVSNVRLAEISVHVVAADSSFSYGLIDFCFVHCFGFFSFFLNLVFVCRVKFLYLLTGSGTKWSGLSLFGGRVASTVTTMVKLFNWSGWFW